MIGRWNFFTVSSPSDQIGYQSLWLSLRSRTDFPGQVMSGTFSKREKQISPTWLGRLQRLDSAAALSREKNDQRPPFMPCLNKLPINCENFEVDGRGKIDGNLTPIAFSILSLSVAMNQIGLREKELLSRKRSEGIETGILWNLEFPKMIGGN
jgi:hypothetical protein